MLAGVAFAFIFRQVFYENKPAEMTEEEQKLASEPQIPVMVAKGNLQAGQELTAQNIRFQRFPESQVPWNAIFLYRDVIGRRLVRPVLSDRLISLSDLTSPEENPRGTIAFIPPGYQSVNIEIPAINDSDPAVLAQLQQRLHPQDHVTISVMQEDTDTEEGEDSSSRPAQRKLISRIICENVEVYRVSSAQKGAVASGSSPAGRIAVLSLLLNESQQKELREAAKVGNLVIVPRRHKVVDSSRFADSRGQDSRGQIGTFSDRVEDREDREGDGLVGGVLVENALPVADTVPVLPSQSMPEVTSTKPVVTGTEPEAAGTEQSIVPQPALEMPELTITETVATETATAETATITAETTTETTSDAEAPSAVVRSVPQPQPETQAAELSDSVQNEQGDDTRNAETNNNTPTEVETNAEQNSAVYENVKKPASVDVSTPPAIERPLLVHPKNRAKGTQPRSLTPVSSVSTDSELPARPVARGVFAPRSKAPITAASNPT